MRSALAIALLVAATLASCGGDGDTVSGPPPAAPSGIVLTSAAFRPGAPIPKRYSCDGPGVSPPLAWSRVPRHARELALLVEDPDASGGTFVHWSLWGMPPSTRRLAEGADTSAYRVGKNSFGDSRYGGPCPPGGDSAHRYVFTLYALSRPLGLAGGAEPDDVRGAIAKAAIARGTLTGTYDR